MPWRTLYMGLAVKKGETLHDYALRVQSNVRELAKQGVRFGQNTLEKWEQMLTRRWGLSTQRVQLMKARTFRFGNDETLETRTLAILPVGIAGG